MPRPRKQALSRAEILPDATLLEPDDPGPDDGDQRPSKSALKREAHELQRLGDALVALRPDRLAEMPIEEPLREAIELARRIKARGGLRRQRQLIGKLMREADAGAIREALEGNAAGHRAEVALAHAAEDWRARLLADASALAAFRHRFGIEPEDPALARLVEQARFERAGNGSGGAYRKLYRALLTAMREHLAARGEAQAPREPDDRQESP